MRELLSTAKAFFVAGLLALSPSAFGQDEMNDRSDWLDVELGKSIVLDLPKPADTVAMTNPEIAEIVLSSTGRLMVQGLALGETDLVVEYKDRSNPMRYEVVVHRNLGDLIRRIDSIVEGEPPRVYPLEERIVVEGAVDDLDTLEQIALVTRLFDEDFVNLMQVRGDHQVQLEVMFAEVSRSGLRQLGLNVLLDSPTNGITASMIGPINSAAGILYTVPSAAEIAHEGQLGVPAVGGYDFGFYGANLGGFNVGAIMDILDDYRLGKILAQPTLVSLSGQQAEFLAGGELPVPSPSGQAGTVQIEYKPYGIQLVFIPTVLANNVIDVRVTVEVSEIDTSASTSISGIAVPGFITRKGKSHMRIESGMTFAMAGMLSDSTSYARAAVPGLGRIPVIGALFRAVSHYREETEVVIYVTPRLVRPLASGEVPAAPGTTENNNPSDIELFLLGVDHRPGSRTAEFTGAVGLQR